MMRQFRIHSAYFSSRPQRRFIQALCLVVSMLVIEKNLSAEGTKQLEPIGAPATSNCKIVLSRNIAEYRIPFALMGCNPDYKLHVHISDFKNEKIYFGFGDIIDYYEKTKKYNDLLFQVKDPSGNIVQGYSLQSLPGTSGNTGYIQSLSEAYMGPDINAGNPDGYTPLIVNPAMNGDYIFEFDFPNHNQKDLRLFKYFDITVAKGTTPVEGRLWSKAWQLSSGGVMADTSASFSLFHIYTNDSIVTRFDCNGLAGGVWTIYSNEWGCATTGTWSDRRRSIPGNTTVKPQYKIFLNNPDPLTYPSGLIGKMAQFEVLPHECDTVITFWTNVTKAGNIEVLLDVPPLNPGLVGPEDVQLGYNVNVGSNTLLPGWNGKNNQGIPLANGTQIEARIRFLNGLTNIPLFDVEDNPKGFKVDIQRPMPSSGFTKLKLFWDDTKLPPLTFPTSNITNGCVYSGAGATSGCHDWSIKNSRGDTNTINSWWYLITDDIMTIPITLQLRPSKGSISGSSHFCKGQSISLRTKTIPRTEQYVWHISGPGFSTDIENNAPDTTLTYQFNESMQTGEYTVSLLGRNQHCSEGDAVLWKATMHNHPEANFTYQNPCQETAILFTDQSIAADALLNKFTWNVESVQGATDTYHGNPVNIKFIDVNDYIVSLTIADLFGCVDTISSIINVKPKPDCSFEIIESTGINIGTVHFENQTTGASEYSWDFGNNTFSALFEPLIKYNLEGDYTIKLVAMNLEGCKDTSVRKYYFMPGLWIPNAFSPNGNGQNEIFRPVTQRTTLDPYQLMVFDRWGQLIFKTTDPDLGWDGKYNGESCPAGSYSYLLQYREAKIEGSETVTLRGMVSLIK